MQKALGIQHHVEYLAPFSVLEREKAVVPSVRLERTTRGLGNTASVFVGNSSMWRMAF